jgi:hypothetical protein
MLLCTFHFRLHWPCYCTVQIFVVIHFCASMWYFRVKANLCRFFLMFIYIYICIAIGDPVIKREWLRSHFNPATFLVSVPSQDLDFQHHMSCLFLVLVREGERCLFVLLILVEYHCLNFLFIIFFFFFFFFFFLLFQKCLPTFHNYVRKYFK